MAYVLRMGEQKLSIAGLVSVLLQGTVLPNSVRVMADKPRVLKISDAWDWFAEAEQLALNARVLLAKGWLVDIACQPESPLWQRAGEMGATLHALPGMRGFHPLAPLGNSLRIARLVDRLQPIILHAYRSPPHSLAQMGRALAKHSVPLVRSRGAAQLISNHALNRWLYLRADAVIATSSKIADNLEQFGVPVEHTHIVRGGVDPEAVAHGDGLAFRRRYKLSPQRAIVGILGRIDEIKGQQYAVEAIAQLNREGVACTLICAGAPRPGADERLRAHITRLQAENEVQLLNHIDDVAGFLAAVDVAVIASIGSEVISRALLEEMSARCAIVATNVGVIPEILDTTTGVLVEARDSAALAKAIGALLGDGQRRLQLGEKARQHVLKNFTLDGLGEQMLQVYASATEIWQSRQ